MKNLAVLDPKPECGVVFSNVLATDGSCLPSRVGTAPPFLFSLALGLQEGAHRLFGL